MVRLRVARQRCFDPKRLEYCRKRLLAMRRRLEGSLNSSAAFVHGAMAPGVEDEIDVALTSVERELSSELGGVFSNTIAEIDHALERLADGTYGICEECGRHIVFERLRTLPSASLCVRCKRRQESEETACEEPRPRWAAAEHFHLLYGTEATDRFCSLAARRLG